MTLSRWQAGVALAGLVLAGWTLGCGMAAAPQPPSLQLPRPIADLTASRTGNQVSLQWKTPRETTDRLKIEGAARLRICRQEATAACATVATILANPGKSADYTDVLPPALLEGPLRPVRYEIFGINKHGRSAGPSNAAAVLAGAAPPAVLGLSATLVERGVVLRWLPAATLPPDTQVQLQRTLLTPPSVLQTKTQANGPLAPVSEPVEQTLRVKVLASDKDADTALDSSVAFGRTYRYVASRVTEKQIQDGTVQQILQVTSTLSAPVTLMTRDIFPPHVPVGLAAVPLSAAINNGVPEVDLSWSSNTEPDLAQYRVYRRDVTPGATAPLQELHPQKMSDSMLAPAFRDLQVEPGHVYAYSVAAVDQVGNTSARSSEVEAMVPAD